MAGLPWIKLYRDLPGHEKSRKLAKFTGNMRAWTHVVELWLWAASNQADGDMSYTPDAAIGIAAGWYDKPERFAAALREAGFLDPDGMLHGWEEEQASHAERLRKDRDRKAKSRGPSDGDSAGQSTGTSTGHVDSPPERPQDSPPDLPLRAKILDLESRDSAREEISIKIPAAVADGVQPNLFATSPQTNPPPPEKQTKPKRPPPTPEQAAAVDAERAEGDVWRDAYIAARGMPPEDFKWGPAWFLFRKERKGRGLGKLLQSINGLSSNTFYRRKGPASWLANDAIIEGLGAASTETIPVTWRPPAGSRDYNPAHEPFTESYSVTLEREAEKASRIAQERQAKREAEAKVAAESGESGQ